MEVLKRYLGDSVYADRDQYGGIIIYLDNGDGVYHDIYLEYETAMALVQYIRETYRRKDEADNGNCV